VRARLGSESVDAIAFVVNHRHPHYAGSVGAEPMVEALSTARGVWGSNRHYFLQTLHGLRAHGIVDRRLEAIARQVSEARDPGSGVGNPASEGGDRTTDDSGPNGTCKVA
jgi:cation transport regulator ChaC